MFHGAVSGVDPNESISGRNWFGDSSQTGIAHEMDLDPHVKAAGASIIDPIIGADWKIKPHSKDPFAKEVAGFVSWNLFERIDWHASLRDALYYVRDGSAVLELTDDVVDTSVDQWSAHPGAGKAIALTGCYGIQRRTIDGWIQSKENPRKISGIRQLIFGSDVESGGFIEISADRLLRFTWDQEGANFDGNAPYRCAYQPYKIRKMYLLVGAIQAEREGAGVPVMELPEGATPEDKDAADDILEGIKSSHKGRMVLPDGFKFRFEAPHGTPIVFEERVAKCNFDIAHGISRSGWMMLGHNSDTGSYALASEQGGQYVLCLERHTRFIEGVWNHGSDHSESPIHRLVRLNYGEKGLRALPKLTAALPTQDWSVIWPIVQGLQSAGLVSSDDSLEAFARQTLRLPQAEDMQRRERSNEPTADAKEQQNAGE